MGSRDPFDQEVVSDRRLRCDDLQDHAPEYRGIRGLGEPGGIDRGAYLSEIRLRVVATQNFRGNVLVGGVAGRLDFGGGW